VRNPLLLDIRYSQTFMRGRGCDRAAKN